MSFTVRLRRKNAITSAWETAYTFAANPFISPDYSYAYDDQEPPLISTVNKTWTLDGWLYGTDKFQELTAVLEDTTTPVHGVQLVRNSTVIEEISAEGGYVLVQVTQITSPKVDTQWQGKMPFTLKVTGTKRLPTSGTISDLSMTETWSYGEEGLLTQTLVGELTAASGSAADLARTLGLSLPDSTFAFVTAGPEGVDVEQLDRADTHARFTSIIKQSGVALPPGVGPSFSVEVRTATDGDEQITTTTVNAVGPGALAAVKSQRPVGRLTEEIASDDYLLTARAVYVEKKPATGSPALKTQKFTAFGGGRPTRWTGRNGGRRPVPHPGSFQPLTIDEEITIEVFGSPGTLDFKVPAPLVGVNEDTGAFRSVGPFLVERGRDASANKWRLELRRAYSAADFYNAFQALAKSAFAPGESSSLDAEVKRRDEGIVDG